MYQAHVILRHYSNGQCLSCFLFEQRLPQITLLSLTALPSHRGVKITETTTNPDDLQTTNKVRFPTDEPVPTGYGPALVVLPVLLFGDDLQLIALS